MRNQMSEVESYIVRFDPQVQQRLLDIRSIVFEHLPHAEERIYYGIPTITTDGKDILFYVAYKNHISLIIGYDLTDFLKSHYPQYQYTRATIKFPHADAFPHDMVGEICMLLKDTFTEKGSGDE